MKVPKFLKDVMFWKWVALAAIIGSIMFVSVKYEIDWMKVVQQFLDSLL